MNEIALTIIIPCYNAKKTITETLESLNNQTNKDFKVVIIDDGSIDHTLEVVYELIPRLHLDIEVFKQSNSGVSATRNFGMKRSNTRYIAFLDADDRYHPEFIEMALKQINTGKFDTVGSRYFFTDSVHDKFEKISDVKFEYKSKWEFVQLYTHKRKEKISFGNFIYKNEILKEYGIEFDESLKYGEDTLFLCEYLRHCEKGGIFIDYPLYAYYQNPYSATHKMNYQITDNIIACTRSVDYWKSDAAYKEQWGRYFIARSVWAAAKTFGEYDHALYRKFITSYSNIRKEMAIMRKYGDERSIRFSAKIYLLSPIMFEICMNFAKKFKINR